MAYLVSDAYLTHINGLGKLRKFKGRVVIYFNGLDNTPVTLVDNDIYEIDFLSDSNVMSNMPFGQIALKTITISLENTQRQFTVTNKNSPYYGKLLSGVPIDAFISLLVDPINNVYEEIPLGRVYAGDWNVSSDAGTATITGYDKLYTYYKVETPKIGIIKNTNIGILFETLLKAMGFNVDSFTVEEDVYRITVPFGWVPGTTFKESLLALCLAGACNILVTRDDKILVSSAYSSRTASRRLRNSEQIVNVEQPQSLYNAYKGATVSYAISSEDTVETSVSSTSNMTLTAGDNKINNLAFSNAPVAKVTSCILTDKLNHTITPTKIGALTMDAIITAVASTTATLEVKGYVLKQSVQTITADKSSNVTTLQDSRLAVNSPLIQTAFIAQDYANILVATAVDPSVYLTASLRGDPSIDLLDKVFIHPDAKTTEMIPIIVTRLGFTYTGGLRGTLEGTKAEALEKYKFMYMGPGFYTRYLKQT